MFVHHCTACDRDQLIFTSQVRSFADAGHGSVGVQAELNCWCGADQTHLFGARREELVAA